MERIPNYFGMWDQQISANIWSPSLVETANRLRLDQTLPPQPPRDKGDIIPWQFSACGRSPRCRTEFEPGCAYVDGVS